MIAMRSFNNLIIINSENFSNNFIIWQFYLELSKFRNLPQFYNYVKQKFTKMFQKICFEYFFLINSIFANFLINFIGKRA